MGTPRWLPLDTATMDTLLLLSLVAVWAAAKAGSEPGHGCTDDLDANKPHVIFILADDIGFNDVSWNNPEEVHTPNLQALGDEGIILDYNYVQPVCSPSRGALNTGKFGHRIGMQHSVLLPDVPECLDPHAQKILAQRLKELGYKNHLLGKWHLGFCDESCTPTERGYDSFFGFYNAMQDHYTHDFFGGYEWRENTPAGRNLLNVTGQYTETLIRERAVSLIHNHDPSTPLFMMYASAQGHYPLQLPNHEPSQGTNRETYLGMVTDLDASVGVIVEALKKSGLYDNSIIIFSSDNGGQNGLYSNDVPPWASNYPLRGTKSSAWEGGTRVPGLVHSPQQTVTAVRTNEMLHISDWFPTIVEMAGGCPDSSLDGVNQADLILNNGASARDEFVY